MTLAVVDRYRPLGVLFYLVTTRGQSTIRDYLRTRGRALAGIVTVIPYERLHLMRTLELGAYVFSDIERLGADDAERAGEVWRALARHGTPVLNHPTRSMRRFELLRTLREHGINVHDVHRLTDPRRPERFPVFIRRENDHAGSLSRLLHTPEQLAAEIERFEQDDRYRDDLIITEFCDTAGEDGVFRKYSAYKVGDRIVPRHVMFSRSWAVKIVDLFEPEHVAEELAYVEANPHADALREIFALGRIDFGRIDYGLRDGKIEVWEINTNPILGTFEDGGMPAREPVLAVVTPQLEDALRAVDASAPASRTRVVVSDRSRGELFKRRVRPVVDTVLHALDLEWLDAPISRFLGRARRLLLGDPQRPDARDR